MPHQAEKTKELSVQRLDFSKAVALSTSQAHPLGEVVFVGLPTMDFQPAEVLNGTEKAVATRLGKLAHGVQKVARSLPRGGKLVLYGDTPSLCFIHPFINSSLVYNIWIAVRTDVAQSSQKGLPTEHKSLVIYTKGDPILHHAKVRIAYDYCPACNRSTKDYGGKKHLYPSYGTLMSDVWKDFSVNPDAPCPSDVIERVRDMFSIEGNQRMSVVDAGGIDATRELPLEALALREFAPPVRKMPGTKASSRKPIISDTSGLFNGDALELLSHVADESIDFAFADPPYNLSKRYSNYGDSIDIERYFDWCDEWLEHCVRVLKPGGSLVILNLPLWSVRHFWYLCQRLTFQNWIAWEGLSLPVRFIMPAHYTLLFFTKEDSPKILNQIPLGLPLPIPSVADLIFDDLLGPREYTYCTRAQCLASRRKKSQDPRRALTDLWTDIARVKHNTRRLDHPCLLPPKLMMRVIALLTNPDDVVLDCFNGVGTTTLCAHLLKRRYVGFEISPEYHRAALERHTVVASGGNPFAKRQATPTVKNNTVPRVKAIDYEIPKRTLQLEIRRIATKLGHIPTRDEVAAMARYDIRYYDEYFRNWSEAVAAARTDGMVEYGNDRSSADSLRLFEKRAKYKVRASKSGDLRKSPR